MFGRSLVVVAVVMLGPSVSMVLGQCGCGSVPTVNMPAAPSYTTYYTPTVAEYAPAPYVVNYAPTPYVANYSPASYVANYAPAPYVVNYALTPYIANYAPATPYVSYYAPVAQRNAVYSPPAAQPYVTSYVPVGSSIYGTPKVYAPGEPVRNVLRAITP